MFGNYLKMAWKVLGRRKFFTFVSLFGIGFTMTALLIAVALVDHLLSPVVPRDPARPHAGARPHEDVRRRLACWVSGPGYKFADRYARDLPGVERMSIAPAPARPARSSTGASWSSRCATSMPSTGASCEFAFLEGAPFSSADDDNGATVSR